MDNTQRDQQIAVQFLGGTSVPKLALDHNLSEPSINRILKVLGVDRSQRVKLAVEDRIVDQTHELIGKRLYHHRAFVAYEERPVASKILGWTPKKLAMVEQGHTILTLHDLQAISRYMGQSLSHILEEL